MNVTVRLFAAFRERAGSSEISLALQAGATMSDVIALVGQRVPSLGPLLAAARPVVNKEFVAISHVVTGADELALLPPVSGGQSRFWLTEEVLDAREVERLVEHPSCGAVVTFIGTVRDHSEGRVVDYLEYEAYPGMAEAKMAEIGDEIREKFRLDGVAMVHRLGRCAIGDASIVISVASPHRAAAFEACHYAINRVKDIVPIWKREVWKDGAVWIGMHA
ncbi:MAG: molybdopterin converting factor [Chloroflexota bacterium]|nr:MAG: molybdopterin converting factor [Chloroflexota bacterium]